MVLVKKEKNNLGKFGIALLAVVAATAVTLLIPSLGDGGMYFLFLFLTAIIFSSLRGDWRSGAFAAVLSMILNFFLLYQHGKSPNTFGDWVVLLAFGLAAGFTIFICHAQMEAEAARLSAESRYRAIFEDAITGIYETTLDGKYVTANPKLAGILGFASPADLINKAESLNDVFYVEAGRREEFTRLIKENKTVAGFESEIYRRDGEKIWISENAFVCHDRTGKLTGFQGTTIEITDRKKAVAALEKAHAELEQKVAERTIELVRINETLRGEINERGRVENKLLAAQRQSRRLSAHLQSVREEERNSLARELHDELSQTLTALKIDLVRLGEKTGIAGNSLPAAEFKNKIPAMLAIVDAAMDTTRKIVAELRPGMLDELGLAAAMEWQTGEFQKRTRIKCSLEIEFDENAVNMNVKTTIFRILQECLTNIVRHSGATAAKIRLCDEENRIFFEVEDNGSGFDCQQVEAATSFGILGMRERVLLLGGTTKISRTGTGGTRVSVSIPRPPPAVI